MGIRDSFPCHLEVEWDELGWVGLGAWLAPLLLLVVSVDPHFLVMSWRFIWSLLAQLPALWNLSSS